MHVNLFFDGLSNGELLTIKTGPPCLYIKILYTIHKECGKKARVELDCRRQNIRIPPNML